MKVEVDRSSGFCWGVVRTIEIVEQELEGGREVYSLGEIIHNPMEIERLRRQGLQTISVADFERLKGKTVLIRAHGEPPSTYEAARKYGVHLVDATCPVVTKVQERIRKFHRDGYQVVIFGKADHAEVVGLVGQTNGEAVVVRTLEEAAKLRTDRKTVLFSQTTMDKPTFYALADLLRTRMKEVVIGSIEEEALEFHAKDTICGQVSGREKKIREFARTHDVILFVAGHKSSNGKVLFEIVKSENPRTYFVEDLPEFRQEWVAGAASVGITGATSTPQWLMERMRETVEAHIPAAAHA